MNIWTYLKTYLETNLENNRKKLLKTLKNCLQLTYGNRPDCSQLLEKINEFSVDKSLLTEDNKTYEEFGVYITYAAKIVSIFSLFLENCIYIEF